MFFTGYAEDYLARIYHVELASCHTLNICIIFTELFLRFDLLELLAQRLRLRDKGTVLCLEARPLFDDVGKTRETKDGNNYKNDTQYRSRECYSVCLVMHLAQDQFRP